MDKVKTCKQIISEQEAEIARLREGIQAYLDGNYVKLHSDCDHCAAEHFRALLEGGK
jgi:hypothetical protein